MAPSFGDLDTKGFVVVRSFLDPEQLARLRTDYATGPKQSPSYYFGKLKPLGADALAHLTAPMRTVLRDITAQTRVHVDTLVKGFYFATDVITFPWHQDADFWVQDRANFLNLYLPIEKPDRAKSNLCVVPYDAWQRVSPDTQARLRNSLANRFERHDGKTINLDHDRGRRYVIDADIEQLAVTPELDAGDLLIVRADVVHRTQDADTRRIAASIRVAWSQSVVRRDDLVRFRLQKLKVMTRGHVEYGRILQCFRAKGRDEITMAELLGYTETSDAPPMTKAAFLRSLFYLNLRRTLSPRTWRN
jgi:hypothetical protein